MKKKINTSASDVVADDEESQVKNYVLNFSFKYRLVGLFSSPYFVFFCCFSLSMWVLVDELEDRLGTANVFLLGSWLNFFLVVSSLFAATSWCCRCCGGVFECWVWIKWRKYMKYKSKQDSDNSNFSERRENQKIALQLCLSETYSIHRKQKHKRASWSICLQASDP